MLTERVNQLQLQLNMPKSTARTEELRQSIGLSSIKDAPHAGGNPVTGAFDDATTRPAALQPSLLIKIDQPHCFDGTSSQLSNFRFTVTQYCDTMGLVHPVRCQQFASQLLTGHALTWWRTVCERADAVNDDKVHATWSDTDFLDALETAFQDIDHVDHLHCKLSSCHQTHSVQ